MLDEQIDHIIREAAEKHHPAYNDKAWEKMGAQLDKHLPQKKDRKKFIFFMLFFLLLGGGVLFSVIKFTINKTMVSNTVAENKTGKYLTAETASATTLTENKNTTTAQTGNTQSLITGNTANTANTGLRQGDNTNPAAYLFTKNKKSKPANSKKSDFAIAAAKPFDASFKGNGGKIKNDLPQALNAAGKTKVAITTPELENDENENADRADLKTAINKTAKQPKEAVKKNEDIKTKDVAKAENKTSSPPDKKKTKNKFAANFGLTFSAGPDLSFVELNNLGKTTLTYGAGLSYSFAKRLTVKTGFYFTKKIYAATPAQYNTGGVTYPYFTGVDARCKVYEIPVSLSYNFLQRKKHNWFAGAGLSSFLMKNEDYDYNYKRPNGQTYKYARSVTNENKHYFAVLTISGGYNYQFNKRISLQAEPFVKLPLSGIGLGKVKLNSSGILFTVTVKPFAKGK